MNIEILDDNATIPTSGSLQSAGYDLYSVDNATIGHGKLAKLRTGIAMQIPDGYVGLIWERSKLASRYGIQVMGGVIDSDYRGEIMISIMNNGQEFEVKVGDKIAQIILQPIIKPELEVVNQLDETERGSQGINSTELRL